MEAVRTMRQEGSSPVSVTATRRFPAHPSVLFRIREFLRHQAGEAGLALETTNDLVLAASEACSNSLRHTRTRVIEVTWTDFGSQVEASIRDEGMFRFSAPSPALELERGHGIPLMMALVDEVHIQKGSPREPGTIVRLVKRRHVDGADQGHPRPRIWGPDVRSST